MESGQIKPIYKPTRKPLYFLSLLFLLLIIAFGVLITYLVGKNKQSKIAIQPSATPIITNAPSENVSTSSSNLENEKVHIIIYSKENNIWSVKTDGTSLRQITRDGDGQNILYPAYQFLEDNKIVYLKCLVAQNLCSVINRDLLTDEETQGVEISSIVTAFTQSNGAIPNISYITKPIQGPATLVVKTGETSSNAIEFAAGLGRGGSLSDQVSIEYSPNGQYLLVVNTTTQPNLENNNTTIWILDKNGNIIDSISAEFASNAIWEGNNGILYLDSGNLYRKLLGSQPSLLGSLDGHNINLSPDGKTLIYWNTADDGTTSIYSYNLSDKTMKKITDNISMPKWINQGFIAGYQTAKSSESMFGYELNGLINYSIENNKSSILDSSSSVYNFIVSP